MIAISSLMLCIGFAAFICVISRIIGIVWSECEFKRQIFRDIRKTEHAIQLYMPPNPPEDLTADGG